MVAIKIIETILYNTFVAVYESTGFALCLSFFFMFFFLHAQKHGWKNSIRIWISDFKESTEFRRTFVLIFYVSLVLFRTLFNRMVWINPLRDIMGGWGFYSSEGKLSGENIENIILFIPFPVLLFGCCRIKRGNAWGIFKTLYRGVLLTFVFSATIEFAQLFFSLGTFQISDLVYNTLGGSIGSITYAILCKICPNNT